MGVDMMAEEGKRPMRVWDGRPMVGHICTGVAPFQHDRQLNVRMLSWLADKEMFGKTVSIEYSE
jgi:hypothetical protein